MKAAEPVRIGRGLGAAVLALYGAATFYLMMPFSTEIPGLSTFTLLKLATGVLLLAGLPALQSGAFRSGLAAAAVRLAPFGALAAWVLLVAPCHGVDPELDVKMMAGFGAAWLAGCMLAAGLADEGLKSSAIRVLVWGGVAAIAGGLLEPATTPAWDGFWKYFRPWLPVYKPIVGRVVGLEEIHWMQGGQYRVSGFAASPNHLANFFNGWFPLAAAAWVAKRRPGKAVWAVLGVGAWVFASTLTRSAVLSAGGAALAVAAWLALPVADGATRRRFGLVGALLLGAVAVAGIVSQLASSVLVALVGMAMLAALAVALGPRAGSADPAAGGAALARRIAIVGAIALAGIPVLSTLRPLSTVRLAEGGGTASNWRREVWRVAAGELVHDPVRGPGYYAFYDALSRHPELFRHDIDNPHNLYLTAAMAGGLPATGLLLLGLVSLLRHAARAARGRIPGARPFGAAFLWYWGAFLLLGLVGQNVFPINEAIWFFALAALTVSVVPAPGGMGAVLGARAGVIPRRAAGARR